MVSFLEHLARGRLMNFLYNINFHNKRLRFRSQRRRKERRDMPRNISLSRPTSPFFPFLFTTGISLHRVGMTPTAGARQTNRWQKQFAGYF